MKGIALILLIAAALLFAIMVVFTIKKKKRKQTKAEKQRGNQSNAGAEKDAKPENRESLSRMMDEMEKENEEKFYKDGNQQAGQRLASIVSFKEKMQSSCRHEWVMSSEDGHLYCSKCGEDGGSPWDC